MMQTNEFHLIKSDRITLLVLVDYSDIPFASHARNLRITISTYITMDDRITYICRSIYVELRCISRIHCLPTVNATTTFLCAFFFFFFKLDYRNFLLSGSPQYILDKLQSLVMEFSSMVICSLFCAVYTGYQYAQEDFNPVLQHFH